MDNKLTGIVAVMLLLSQFVIAEDLPAPKMIGKSKVFLEINWTMAFGSPPGSFTFKTFGFPTTAVQTARMESYGHGYAQKQDEYGNTMLEYSFTPAASDLVGLRTFVDVDYSKGQPADNLLAAYSEQTELTRTDAEMDAKAAAAVQGAKNGFEKLVMLTGYVHNRIEYDGAGYGATVESARTAFYSQRGTCDEYSHVLLGMLRSQGIAARFVAGYVCSINCSQSEKWGPHAWVEAAVDGEWVAADPTFNEARLLDATHVKFAVGRDQNDIKETYDRSLPQEPQRSATISLDDWQPFGDYFSIGVSAPAGRVGEGSIETVNATVRSNANAPIAVPLSLNVPEGVTVASGDDVLLYLEPRQEKTAGWKVIIPEDLQKGYVYNYTVIAESLGKKAEAYVIAKLGGGTNSESGMRMADFTSVFLPDGTLELRAALRNTGNEVAEGNASLESNAGDVEKSFSLNPGETRVLTFSLAKEALPAPGTEVAGTITLKTGFEETVQPFTVSISTPAPLVVDMNQGIPEWLIPGLAGLAALLVALVLLRKFNVL